jgi:peptidoglycan/LPS O-acetylase OafA/YrhL
MDATVTLVKRTMRGEKITEAHREHYYQRLVQIGWGHRNVALVEYVLMLAAGVSAILGISQPGMAPWLLLLTWCATYMLLMLAVDSRWQTFKREQHG